MGCIPSMVIHHQTPGQVRSRGAVAGVTVLMSRSDVSLVVACVGASVAAGAQFENSVLTMAMFGRDGPESPWANLKGAHFEGALISSSDVGGCSAVVHLSDVKGPFLRVLFLRGTPRGRFDNSQDSSYKLQHPSYQLQHPSHNARLIVIIVTLRDAHTGDLGVQLESCMCQTFALTVSSGWRES